MTTTTYQYSGPGFNYTYLGGPPGDGANLTGTVTFNIDTTGLTGWYGAAATQLFEPITSDPIVDVTLSSGSYSGSLSTGTPLNGGPLFYLQNDVITQWYVNFVSGGVDYFTENWPIYTEDSLFVGYPVGQSGTGEIFGVGSWTVAASPPPPPPTITSATINNPASPTVISGSGVAGDTVTLYVDGSSTPAGSGTVDSNGLFHIAISNTSNGAIQSVAGTQTDPQGQTSAQSSPFGFVGALPAATDPNFNFETLRQWCFSYAALKGDDPIADPGQYLSDAFKASNLIRAGYPANTVAASAEYYFISLQAFRPGGGGFNELGLLPADLATKFTALALDFNLFGTVVYGSGGPAQWTYQQLQLLITTKLFGGQGNNQYPPALFSFGEVGAVVQGWLDAQDGAWQGIAGDPTIYDRTSSVGVSNITVDGANVQIVSGPRVPDTSESIFVYDRLAGRPLVVGDGNNFILELVRNQTIRMGDGNNFLLLDGGGNHITADNGSNFIGGATGNDLIWLGDGNNIVIGGPDDKIFARNGNNVITTGADSQIRVGDGSDTITAGDRSKIWADNGNDLIHSGAGSSLWLGDGNDTVYAGANNSITLGNGNDLVYMGADDKLTLGHGSDTVVIGVNPQSTSIGSELINGFNPSRDQITFSAALFTSFASMMADAKQVGHDTVISYNAQDSVTLRGVSLNSLTASNFHFT
jgi:Bacterial Ig domain